jgi:hypothetical protein
VRLDGERHADGLPDGRAEEDVVREQVVRREMLPHGRRVVLDEARALRSGQILEIAGLEILVAVEHEHRQRAFDPGPDDSRAREIERLGVRLLAEDDHLVAEAAPGPGERAGVDVRARPAQEVAMPEENLHAWMILTHLS